MNSNKLIGSFKNTKNGCRGLTHIVINLLAEVPGVASEILENRI